MVGYKNPPSIEKSRRIGAAFEAKVLLLERWARYGVPDECLKRARPDGTLRPEDLPRNNTQLRRWRGPNGDLDVWSDPVVDRPVTGKHPKLAARFRLAIESIDKWLGRKIGRLSALEHELQVLESKNVRLMVQNAELLGRIQQLEENLALAEARERAARR
jgi:hypothetical protein